MAEGVYLEVNLYASVSDALADTPIPDSTMYWSNPVGDVFDPDPDQNELLNFVSRDGSVRCHPYRQDATKNGLSIYDEGTVAYSHDARFTAQFSDPVPYDKTVG